MIVPTMQTIIVKVVRYEGTSNHCGKLGKMTSMAVVGHNMNSTFTDRTTSTIYAPVIKSHISENEQQAYGNGCTYLKQEEVKHRQNPDTNETLVTRRMTQGNGIAT